MGKIKLLLCFVGLLFLPNMSRGQAGTTSIVGDVTDPQGRPVSRASVSVTDAASAVSREGQTDGEGHYQFLSLPPVMLLFTRKRQDSA